MKYFIIFISIIFIHSCSSNNWETLKLKTENALNENNYPGALEYLEKALLIEPENAEVHYYLGQTYRLMLFKDGSLINEVNMPYASKSSEHFRKSIAISPRYEGKKFIVDPYTKIQSIWGAVVMTYLFNGNPDSARWAFENGQNEGGFYPAIMEFNKNIMASCEKNAILFTNGDNDTYPMWFLQLNDKYRTDITVVNLSLLNIPWYIKQLKNSYPFGENNLFIDLSDTSIDNYKPQQWKEKVTKLPVTHDPLNKEGKIEWVVKPTINGKGIRIQDLMLLNILKSNNWNRPVYFSSTVYKGNKIGLDKYLTAEGLVYRLNSHKAKISTEKLYSNLRNVYTYNGVNDKHIKYVDEVASLYQNYHYSFITLAKLFDETGEKEDVIEVLNLMEQVLPDTILPYKNEELKREKDKLKEKTL